MKEFDSPVNAGFTFLADDAIEMTIVMLTDSRKTWPKMLGIIRLTFILVLALNMEAQEPHSPPQPLRTAPATPSHPLDPLTAPEFGVLKEILQEQGKFSDKTIYGWVQLQEPPKEEVLAFQPGQKFRREAQVVAISREKKTAFEILVDLNAKKIESIKDLGNLQPFLVDSEFKKAEEIVDASPEARAALEKRGYHIKSKISDAFFLDTYAPGKDPLLLEKGKKTIRAVRVLFADRQGGTNDYGPYVEGLMALVDVYGGKLIALEDNPGAIAHQAVPEDIFSQDVLGPKFNETNLQITPSTLQNIKLDGNHLQWENWDFRFSFNQREGLVLHQIAFNDHGKLRSICYRASISEMLVPYSDPSKSWIWREFFDSGEYGLGLVSTEANAGKDLPGNAVTLDAVFPTESLELSKDYPNRVFIYERDGGGLFAHTQPEDGSRIYARAKELVMGFVATVGNYDYLYKWVFREDGAFSFEAELHGLILNKTIKDETCQVCAVQATQGPGTYLAQGDQRFGTIVSPQIAGIFHQHWINLRMDFDIDGPANAVEECNTKLLPYRRVTNPRGRAFTVERTVFGREKEAERNLNLSTNRTWIVYNPSVKSPVGHYSGYEIEPAGNTVSAIPEYRFGEESSFIQRHLWVTKYHSEQLYAAGKYPNQAPADYKDDLSEYARRNENIYKEDVVLWYSMGFTHITRPEDYPIMPAGKMAVSFTPVGFFEKSPALGYAHIEKESSGPGKP
jgi:primary-amine oxidase